MKSELHREADKTIDDVYVENARFATLLEEYTINKDKQTRDELWMIAFRCACNILKRRFGRYWKYDEIEQLALDMLIMLFARIDNKDKFPDGYKVLNLPTTLENIFLTIYYSKKSRFDRENENKVSSLNQLEEKYGDYIDYRASK